MNFDFYLARKGNSLLLIAIFFNLSFIFVNAGGGNTNIVLTKDTLVLNDRHKKHSNNIVIKDNQHKEPHHCDCHHNEHHIFVPMHHYTGHHHEHWSPYWDDSHKRADSIVNNWWDMQMAASNQQHTYSPAFHLNDNRHYEKMPNLINGNNNEALNQLVNERYFKQHSAAKFNLEKLQKIAYPVFVNDN